jgi:hypothetical protein
MQKLKYYRDWIFQRSPGYEKAIEEERSYTSKMLYARSRIGFTRIWAPGTHIEAEEYIFDKRLKGSFFRHFKYFGPRGEFAIYFITVVLLCKLVKNNLTRENNIESLLNDRNVYFKVDLPLEHRKIN